MESGHQPAIVIEPWLGSLIYPDSATISGGRFGEDSLPPPFCDQTSFDQPHDHSLASFGGEKLFGDGFRRFA